jgi:hypothetical protein
MVLFVRFEVLRQATNALAQNGNLDFRAAGIRIVRTVTVNDVGFLLSR